MKKIVLILLISVYALSSLGVGLKEFYCCGKLKSVTVALAQAGKDKCGKMGNNEDCCKTKYQFFKLSEKHVASGNLAVPVKHFINPVSLAGSYRSDEFSPVWQAVIYGSHAPPRYTGVAIYISNCVFRV